MKRVLFVWMLLTGVAVGCKHENGPQPAAPVTGGGGTGTGTGGAGGGTSTPPDTALCFERDVLPIFISNCAKPGCHDAAGRQDGYVFTSWATITAKKFVPGNPAATKLYEAITDDDPADRMPPLPADPLTATQIGVIRSWIARGAPNTGGCTSACDTAAFTFSGTIQPLLNQYCAGCHGTAAPSGGITLTNHAGVRLVAGNGRLLGAVRHTAGYSPMPQGGAKLSDCQIRLLEKWVAAGMPND